MDWTKPGRLLRRRMALRGLGWFRCPACGGWVPMILGVALHHTFHVHAGLEWEDEGEEGGDDWRVFEPAFSQIRGHKASPVGRLAVKVEMVFGPTDWVWAFYRYLDIRP